MEIVAEPLLMSMDGVGATVLQTPIVPMNSAMSPTPAPPKVITMGVMEYGEIDDTAVAAVCAPAPPTKAAATAAASAAGRAIPHRGRGRAITRCALLCPARPRHASNRRARPTVCA